MPLLRTRAATHDDLALTYEITEDAMRGYVEETWGVWDEDEQLQKHRTNFTPETYKIILVKDEVAGLVAVEEFPSHIWLVKLYLLARYRGQGIGSHVLQGIQKSATAQGKPVTLRVLRVNSERKHCMQSTASRSLKRMRIVCTWQVVPNPSFKPSPNGVPRGPGWRYPVHFRPPGPRVTPLVPA